MKRRVLLAVLVCFSLILGVMIHVRGDTDRQMQQVLAELDRLPKSERDLFNSNAIDFYKHTSKAAREERKRLRSLHQQVQNDPECERLTKTMEQYVNWVKQVDDPVAMRMLQGHTIEGRVEAIKLAVHGEQQSNTTEMFTTERLREHLLEDLPPELKDFSFPALYGEFDLWLTKKYDEEKTKLAPKQLEHLPVFETFYGNLFRSWRGDTFPSETLDVPGKLAMLQLIQNLSSEPRLGGGGGFGRFGRISMVSFWRDAFFEQQKTALDNGEPNMFDQIEDEDLRKFLLQMPQAVRNDTLQRLLALAILKQYPKFTVNIFGFFGFADPNRVNLELGLDAKRSIDLLGTYLSIMETRRRDDFLKMNPHHANVRLQAELWGNAMALADLTRPTSERFGGGRPGGGPGGGQGGGQGGRLGGGQGGGPGGPGGETPGGPPPDGRREGGPRNMPPETRPRDDRVSRPGRSNRLENEPATPQTRRNDPPIEGGA